MEVMKIKEEEYLTDKFTMEETPRKRALSKCHMRLSSQLFIYYRHLTVTTVNTALNSLKECFYTNSENSKHKIKLKVHLVRSKKVM